MPQYVYHLLDVFTTEPFGGNPLAVFPIVNGINPALMQRLANELNLSETVFILPPDDPKHDYHLRIFTPAMELPMAGHPTIGTGSLLAHLGMIALDNKPVTVFLEEGIGPIEITLHPGDPVRVSMRQPVPTFGDIITDRDHTAALLNLATGDLADDLPVQTVSSGVPFVYIPLRSLDALKRIQFREDIWQQSDIFTGRHIYAFTIDTQQADATVRSRMFAPAMDIREDPATGAACGPLGAYLVTYDLADGHGIVNMQGVEMGRASRIEIDVTQTGDTITDVQISGSSVYMGTGTFYLPE